MLPATISVIQFRQRVFIYIFSNSLFVVIGNTRVNHTLTDCSNLEWKFYNS